MLSFNFQKVRQGSAHFVVTAGSHRALMITFWI